LPGRNYSASSYRFGFNGKENVDEVHGGTGTFQDYGMRDYDTRVARFLKVDPIAKDYPELTPYQFASNSPVWGVDWDGLELRIYTSTQGLTGHTFITVGTGDDMIVYSYGQYGDPGNSSGGYSPIGEGVLYRMTGERARNYVKQYVKFEAAKAYEIEDADETQVRVHMDARFNKGSMAEVGKAKGDDAARVIDSDYNMFTKNCATESGDAAQAGGSKLDFIRTYMAPGSVSLTGIPGASIPHKDAVSTPGEMQGYLQGKTTSAPSVVVDVTIATGLEVE